MRVPACEFWFYLSNSAEKIFRVVFAMLQDSDYPQQVQSAILVGRSAQHGLQFLFRALLISCTEEPSSQLQSSGGSILGGQWNGCRNHGCEKQCADPTESLSIALHEWRYFNGCSPVP